MMRRSALFLSAALTLAAILFPLAGEGAEPPAARTQSYLSKLWELDNESRRATFAITPHNFNYILPFAHETSPNEGVVRAAEPDRTVQKTEVKFQISFKTKLWQDVLGRDMDLWLGYTQLS
ncbi:MAG TPA: phospholipase A, partial [Candidatus Deferrimicrobiaceae bacterium]